MARATAVAWAACAVLTAAGSLTVGGVAAAKVRQGPDPASKKPALSLPPAAPGEQSALPTAANAKTNTSATGGSITRADVDALMAARTDALKGKNRAAFLAGVDAGHGDLVKQQGRLFDNLEKIPFTSAVYKVETQDGGESTFQKAHATVTVDFDHQISGVDSVPVEERYKLTVERTGPNSALEITSVDGTGRSYDYPAPWDVANLTVLTRSHVVVMADDTSSSFAADRADSIESDAEYDFAHWTGGKGTAPGFSVFLTSDRKLYESIYHQDRTESTGVTVAMHGATATDSYPSSRIAIDTTQYKNGDPADADIIFKHEMTHAMVDPFEETGGPGQDHLWVIEGFAEWESERMYPPSQLLIGNDTWHSFLSKHGFPSVLPTNDQVYSSNADTTDLGYFHSELAILYMADKYSPQKVDQFVLSVYKNAASETCVDDAMKNVLGTTTAQFTQNYAAYVRSNI